MAVVLDVSTLNNSQLSGVGIYITQLFQELKNQNMYQVDPVYRWSRWKSRKCIESHLGQTAFTRLGNRLYPGLQKIDLWHGPDFRLPAFLPSKSVVTIHDIAFCERGMCSSKFSEKRIELLECTIGQKPDAIITVSNYTRECLIQRFPGIESRVKAIHLGADHLVESSSVSSGEHQKENYFLFVGNLEARKNVVGILNSFEIFCEKTPGFRLLLIGKPGFGYEDIEATHQKMRHKHQVEFLGYQTAAQLRAFYEKACGFIYPSLFEGFGIPLLEAMSMGCPVITADRTSTKEVAGEAASLVCPEDFEEIAKQMHLLLDKELRQDLIEKGLKRFKEFTWKKTAQNTLGVYSSVLEQSQSLKNL